MTGMPIVDLRIGRFFQLAHDASIIGQLLELGPGSARVRITRETEKNFTTADGKQVTIKKSTESTHWSLMTAVIPIPKPRKKGQ